jgi:outer membrane protein assembly factor BamB
VNPNSVVAIGTDGYAHVYNVQNGSEWMPAIEFLPPNARLAGAPILVDNVLYAPIAAGCGAAKSGLWAVDLASQDKKVVNWQVGRGSIAGSSGPALGTDGSIYLTTDAGALAALEPKTLRLKQTASLPAGGFSSSPVIFQFKGREFVAASSDDGKIYAFEASAFVGATPATAAGVSKQYAGAPRQASALTAWQDSDGTPWILVVLGKPVPGDFTITNGVVSNGTIAAFKVIEQGSGIAIEPVWTARDLLSPLTPIVVNGVVFALSSGASAGPRSGSSTTPAVLYALDGRSGKTLWSSGNTVTAPAHGGGLVATAGQIYFVTRDGTLWAFGMPTVRE